MNHHGSYFATNPDNPAGLKIEIQRLEGGEMVRARTTIALAEQFEGPPGHVHGGVTAAILDELMGQVVWMNDYQALLATMTNNYHLPVPLHASLTAEAWVTKIEGRKIFAAGRLSLIDGRQAVSSTGLYIHVPGFFKAE